LNGVDKSGGAGLNGAVMRRPALAVLVLVAASAPAPAKVGGARGY
jgi:hypothetical protein